MSNKTSVIVIGAGIAGATTAFMLKQAGFNVLVLEAGMSPANGASINPVCIMYPRLEAQWNKYTLFYLEAYKYALQFYQDYPDFFIQTGVFVFARDRSEKKFPIIAEMLSSEICEFHAGYLNMGNGLLFPQSGCLYVRKFCEFLLKDIETKFKEEVALLRRNSQGEWSVLNSKKEVLGSAEHVIIASGYSTKDIISSLSNVIYGVRGQSSITEEDIGYNGEHTLCFPDISITPMMQGKYYFGSSYDRNNLSLDLSVESQKQNIDSLSKYFPKASNIKEVKGAVGNRCFTKDYLPIVGPVPGHNNLYINIAHGSRGVTSAPLSALMLKNQIVGEMDNDIVAKIVQPERYLNFSLML